jgi:hypothetical protein
MKVIGGTIRWVAFEGRAHILTLLCDFLWLGREVRIRPVCALAIAGPVR